MHCHYCGSKVSKEDSVCKKCGYNLELSVDKESKSGLMHPALQWIIFAIIVTALSFYISAISNSGLESIADYSFIILFIVCFIFGTVVILSMWIVNKFYNVEKRIIELSECINKKEEVE